jgi:hypothetical protein
VERSDFEYLSRKLQGYRVRREAQTWSVERAAIGADGRLAVEVGGETKRRLVTDLPPDFDPHDNEHLAWLLGWIEHSVQETK